MKTTSRIYSLFTCDYLLFYGSPGNNQGLCCVERKDTLECCDGVLEPDAVNDVTFVCVCVCERVYMEFHSARN